MKLSNTSKIGITNYEESSKKQGSIPMTCYFFGNEY
jgi:hypothetical protein